jgi:flagellar P-ring protein precursor FlgI
MSIKFHSVLTAAFALGVAVASAHGAANVRIKDIARVQANRQHALMGYGLVTGLAGTGDSPANRATRQSMANMLSQFNVNLSPEAVNSRNVAAVMVSASLPSYMRPGDTIDVTVTSVGDARSLVGGNLLVTPLNGPDGKTYVLAQGALTVGGYRYEANGAVGQKNHPTVATIPGGGTLEVSPPSTDMAQLRSFSVSLLEPDYTNAARIAEAINAGLLGPYAHARDPDTVAVAVPDAYHGRFVELMRQIEHLEIAPDLRARVVVNERTGTVVAGADVRVAPTAISYGELRISIVTENAVSQPLLVRQVGEGVQTQTFANSRIDLQEAGGATFVTQPGGTIADLVQALGKLRTATRDVVSILKALKASGALHAELIVQ